MTTTTKILIGGAGALVVLAGIASWLMLGRTPASSETTGDTTFGTGGSVVVEVEPSTTNDTPGATTSLIPQSQQKVFPVVAGPVAGATLVQTKNPTTTLVRYVQQSNGHVFELSLDTPGAVPKSISNTTIPGVMRALWTQGGKGVVLQYLDDTVKSVYVEFPASSTRAAQIRFLPDGIADIAISPNGIQTAYLLTTSSGTDGYVADVNGNNSRKLFSLPLREVLVSWPAASTLLLQTKSAVTAPGMAFSANVSSGAVVSLVTSQGLTATANRSFTHLVYQGGTPAGTYVRNMQTGSNTPLSFDPIPEKCVWSSNATSTMYCAVALSYTPPNYLDLWHQGASVAVDSVVAFNVATGKSAIHATPGGEEGGSDADILELASSPDDRYVIFIRKQDRSLWGVRLGE